MSKVVHVQEKKRSDFGAVFWAAQAGVLGVLVTQPLEFMKVHCQLAAAGHWHAAPRGLLLGQQYTAQYGFSKMWAGIEPAMARQANYIALRFGIYKYLIEKGKANDRYHSVSVMYKTMAAAIAGGISGFLNSPLDFIALRMQADVALPEAQRRNYGYLPSTVSRIISKEGGFSLLFRGAYANTLKVIGLNVGMLGAYDSSTEFVARNVGDFAGVKLFCCYLSAMVGCLYAQPFDNIKTKLQSQYCSLEEKVPPKYWSFSDCLGRTLANEGISGLYVGYWMHVARISVSAFIALKALEYFNYYI